MASIDKTLFCYCHWGGENVAKKNGAVSYVGGTTDHLILNSGIKYDAFVRAVCDRLRIEPSGKVFHFSVKFNKEQLIQLKDQDGVDNLIQFNDDFAHVYVSKDEAQEVDAAAAPIGDSMRGSTSGLDVNQIEDGHVTGDHSDSAPIIIISCTDVDPSGPNTWDEMIVGEGQTFESRELFRKAMFRYSIAKQFTYKFTHNGANYMSVRCTVEGCPWKITAGNERATKKISIKKFVDSHSHSMRDPTTFKPKFNSKLMRDFIKQKILDSPNCSPRELCNDSKRNFDVKLTYHQAWRLKEVTKQLIDGKVEDSYKLIPLMCNRLVDEMPGTIAKWSCTADYKFKSLFISYGCSIRGFHAGCRALIFVDLCHFTSPYKGTLLSASSLDANNEMYPLAFSVLTSKNEEDWLGFLDNLKLVVQNREVVIVSDMNPAIVSGVDKIFGDENHAHCFRSVKENFNKFIDTNYSFRLQSRGRDIAHKYLNDIAYARTMDAYNEALVKMHNFRKELCDWVIASGPERWCNALFNKVRWDCLSSNSEDSFSAWMEHGASLLQIPQMIKTHRQKLSDILHSRKAELETWRVPIGPQLEEKILENQKLGRSFNAVPRSDFEVEVLECRGRKVVVNLKSGTCMCLEWQMTGIPCQHACCAIALANMDVYQCVAGWYKKEVQELIYNEVMSGVSKFDLPHPNEVGLENGSISEKNEVLSPCPVITKRPRGRPRRTETESQHLPARPMRCSRCKGIGHNRKKCKETC